jgi:hypothetical protein
MKVSDFAPRVSAFLTYLIGRNLTGIEVGTDVGAHAHAMLQYCDIEKLYLVDVWDNDYCRGYCEGRLQSNGYKNRIELIKAPSAFAAKYFDKPQVDFIYIDILHDYKSVKESLAGELGWWNHLKSGGVLGYRNYATSNTELKKAVDEFIGGYGLEFKVESYHGEIIIFK